MTAIEGCTPALPPLLQTDTGFLSSAMRPLVRRAWWAVAALLARSASTQGAPAPATKATVLRNPLPKKEKQEKPAETRCRRCRKSGAWLLSVRRRCCGCPPGSACSSVRCRCRVRWALLGAATGAGALSVVAVGRSGSPLGGGGGVGLPPFLCVARSCLKRSWGRRAQP